MKQPFRMNTPHVFLLLFLSCVALPDESNATQSNFEAKANLVSFIPDIFSQNGTKCQGLRVSEYLVVTSPQCVRKITDALKKEGRVEVTDTEKNSIGAFSLSNGNLPVQMLESDIFLPIQANDRFQFEPTFHSRYFLPQESFAVYMNEQGSVSNEEVFLNFPDPDHQTELLVLETDDEDTELPEGSPVYDANDNIVCLITSKNECRMLPESLTKFVEAPSVNTIIPYSKIAIAVSITLGALVISKLVSKKLSPCISVLVTFFGGIGTYLFAYFMSSPQAQCMVTGGCSTPACCCEQ